MRILESNQHQHTMITRKQIGDNTMSTKVIFLLIAALSVASAFNSRATRASMASVNVSDAHTARPFSRGFSTGMYGSRAQTLSSPSSLSQTRRKHTSIPTRLQFSDNASPGTTIESSWWRKLLTSTLTSPKTITPERATPGAIEEQENVDAYLEFLDRRYRRLHSDDEEEQKVESNHGNTKPFSAIDWLTNGGNVNAKIEATTREQQQDALYVLGVAGLASQKLLQKHHLQATANTSQAKVMSTDGSPSLDKVVELKEQIDDAIEVNDETKSLKAKANEVILNNVLLPLLRVIYLAQRQKQLIVKMVQHVLTSVASKVTGGAMNTLSQGPRSILNAMLNIGGGKRNILRTMAIGYATIFVFRPLLSAMLADGLAFDPLIK